jgi:hypothetical protein
MVTTAPVARAQAPTGPPQLPLEEVVVSAPEPRYVAPNTRDSIGRIWAPVLINGKGPYRLVLDTGASRSAVIQRVVDDAGLPLRDKPVKLRGVTGAAIVPAVRADTLAFGDLVIENATLPVVADAFGGADGVLGGEGMADKRIEIQFLPAPDTLVTAAEPSQLVPWHQGLVTPHGVQSVLLRVSNIERALAWYSVLYGTPAWTPDQSRAYFEFPASQTRLYLEQARYEFGQEPGIALFGIKVDAFDKAAVSEAVVTLGGTVLPVEGNPNLLRIRDPDGNVVQLHPV